MLPGTEEGYQLISRVGQENLQDFLLSRCRGLSSISRDRSLRNIMHRDNDKTSLKQKLNSICYEWTVKIAKGSEGEIGLKLTASIAVYVYVYVSPFWNETIYHGPQLYQSTPMGSITSRLFFYIVNCVQHSCMKIVMRIIPHNATK